MAGIVIAGVSRTFGTVRAVDNVSLEVGEGEFFTLLGPSGCGKTTLLRMIAGFTELDGGEIRFGSERIAFWKTPTAKCKTQGDQCVPYHKWVSDYIAVLGGR